MQAFLLALFMPVFYNFTYHPLLPFTEASLKNYMNFSEFGCAVKENIVDFLPEYDIDAVEIREVIKNNNVSFTGIMIILKNDNVTPNIYLEYYYDLFRRGEELNVILSAIAEEFRRARGFVRENGYNHYAQDDYESHVFLRLVNYKKNEKMLEECPYIGFHDLAICFRYLSSADEKGVASTGVSYKELERWDITVEELYKIAEKNTAKLFPTKLLRLGDLLQNMMGCDGSLPEDNRIFVLTNSQNIYGATSMLLKKTVEDFAERVNSDVFILPSSVHEVMLVPEEENLAPEYLRDMVREINKYVVSDKDFLSDNVYRYDRNAKKITV